MYPSCSYELFNYISGEEIRSNSTIYSMSLLILLTCIASVPSQAYNYDLIYVIHLILIFVLYESGFNYGEQAAE